MLKRECYQCEMEEDKIIKGLESLVADRESFITKDRKDCEIFIEDKNVLLAAIQLVKEVKFNNEQNILNRKIDKLNEEIGKLQNEKICMILERNKKREKYYLGK